ncbi:SDR family oxidoreductase [Jeotgalibacillus sp. S-D1]|uniref:SDR family NAD(P)-dependent oxidoreductase n=1 Tax=Jeotgalibacillus sp. S-D1 TaxID=2552189 RepID=UPI001059290F|nr:SDR family oxidoreductase [Jeotgalibacillus sp. S-D1]TDL35224.1 SDR family oxidoreductase [Jeotgalibacillus sp. S-D1]
MIGQRTVVVTGAASGIGLEVAKMYGSLGEHVHLVDINEEKLIQEVNTLKGKGIKASAHTCDVGRLSEVETLFKTISAEMGKIDVLINNAGKSEFKSIWEVSEMDWLSVINSNLSSVFYCSREAARYMENGSIVNMCSSRAFMSEDNTEAYSASKGGIHALTHSLSVTFSVKNITVNAISPGWIETENYQELREVDHSQHLSNRVGKPADIARACVFLTDPQNNFITGENLIIDGGMTRKMIYEH